MRGYFKKEYEVIRMSIVQEIFNSAFYKLRKHTIEKNATLIIKIEIFIVKLCYILYNTLQQGSWSLWNQLCMCFRLLPNLNRRLDLVLNEHFRNK